MADGLTITFETAALVAAIQRLPEAVRMHGRAACKVTADAIASESRARVKRRTGATAASIEVVESQHADGYAVLAGADLRNQGRAVENPFTKRQLSGLQRVPHVATYLEYGTVHHAAAPFFWPSVMLEANAHDRRMREAIQDVIDAEGLGDDGR